MKTLTKRKMNFSCIYTVEQPMRNRVVLPSALWTRSVDEEERKYLGVLTEGQFLTFCKKARLDVTDLIGTCGMVGAPGAEPWYAPMPAWALEGSGGLLYFSPLVTFKEMKAFCRTYNTVLKKNDPNMERVVEQALTRWLTEKFKR